MAVQNLNIGKNTRKESVSIKGSSSAKETVVAANVKNRDVGNIIRSVEARRFEMVALEPAVDFINSYKLNRKTFVNCVVKPNVMIWTLPDGIIGLSRNDMIDGLRNLGERLRGVEVRDRVNANLVVRGFKSFLDSFIRIEGGLKAEVTPDGFIEVTYLGERSVVSKDAKADLSKSNFVQSSYTLKRKEKNGSDWVEIETAKSWGGIQVTDVAPLTLNTEYTYHLAVTNMKTNEVFNHYVDILYKALDVEIADFTATPDPIERRVNLKFDVKNYTNIKIVRKDGNKELEVCGSDTNVEAEKKYRYVLYASNVWYENVKKEAVADCTNVKPTAGKLTYRMENTVRGVVLFMETIKNGFVTAIERQQLGSSEWKTFSPITNQKNYKDYDDSIYPDCNTLKVGETYKYRAKYSNNWGRDSFTYSDPISVKMVNEYALPHMPRMLPPKYAGETIRWTISDRAKSYVVERYDNSNKKDFYKIDSGSDDVEFDHRWPEKKDEIKVFSSISDNQIQKDVQYLYKITARNAWGEAVSYRDVFVPENQKGKDDVGCYKYIGQNENDGNYTLNFQGIATDGTWWYLAAGADWEWYHFDMNQPTIYKAPVDFSLNRGLAPCTGDVCYDLPDPKNVHVGDLDCFGDYLFVAVYKYDDGNYDTTKEYNEEKKKEEEVKHYHGQIWILNKHTMERITTVKINKPDGSYVYGTAWCAVNPCDKRLYTSQSNFYDGKIYSYKINFDNIQRIENGEKNLTIFSDVREVCLYDDCGNPFAKESMQGGCFDYYNNLYLNSGYKDPAKANSGIQVFKLVCDKDATMQNVLSNTSKEERVKKYEAYQSGDWNGSCSYRNAILIARSVQSGGFTYQFNVKDKEEPEGLVYCDFNYSSRKPMKQDYVRFGSFHASLLKNSGNVDWEYMWFKHYDHVYRETVEKHVSYSSLFVVIDSVRGDYKIVDNGILVKRFKTSETANKALNVLKNFKKDNRIGNVIYTIGWLCTSDSNHNYEFTALRRDKKPSLEDMADWKVEYDPQKIIVFGNKEGDPLERYLIRLEDNDGKCYHFLAHNEKDADRIQNILKDYKKICIVGVGPDSEDKNYFSEKKCGCRIRSEYNLIWLEK